MAEQLSLFDEEFFAQAEEVEREWRNAHIDFSDDDLKGGVVTTTNTFITKDSGKRVEFPSGFVRDSADDKPSYHLIPLDCLRRLADLYTRGAKKYSVSPGSKQNWELANTPEEFQRFKASALRHMYQWLEGDTEEDHAMACVWNVFAAEHLSRGAK